MLWMIGLAPSIRLSKINSRTSSGTMIILGCTFLALASMEELGSVPIPCERCFGPSACGVLTIVAVAARGTKSPVP